MGVIYDGRGARSKISLCARGSRVCETVAGKLENCTHGDSLTTCLSSRRHYVITPFIILLLSGTRSRDFVPPI